MIGWLRGLFARPDPIPPAPADMLGAATRVKETGALLTQSGEHVSNSDKLPHVVISPPPDLWRGGVPIEAIHISKAFEGFEPAPYLCSGNKWTIGYGSTRDLFGKPVTRDTPRITETQAMVMATRDLDNAARLAAAAFPDGLPKRWGAVMVLMCNNMGDITRWGPTLRSLLLEGEWRRAADQLRHYRNAAGRPVLGLRRRRWAEAAYALGMDAAEAKRRAWAEIRHVDDWPALPG